MSQRTGLKMLKTDHSHSVEEASTNIISSILRKRTGKSLTFTEIERLISDFIAGRIPDYQMSAWLATIACKGMNIDEIEALTRAYVSGGKSMKLVGVGQKIVDKHSTGGVGDKVSFIVVPIVAACGVPVAKISGRGLGHAGGTLDKLESIKGLKLDLAAAEAQAMIDQVGMVMTGQSAELVPGDKATYQLRDNTGSVESIPLIAASIISKKIAMGADCLVLDVKTGTGALIQDYIEAANLAEIMVELATRFNINCRAVLSDMSQPLGYMIGNALEIKEALSILQGEDIPGLTELCCVVARLMLQAADPSLSDDEAVQKVSGVIQSGAAYEQFLRWSSAQGARNQNPGGSFTLPKASLQQIVCIKESGWIGTIEPRTIGYAASHIKAGRLAPGSIIDHSAGIVLHKRVGDWITAGEPIAEIHYNNGDASLASSMIASAVTLFTERPEIKPIIHRIY